MMRRAETRFLFTAAITAICTAGLLLAKSGPIAVIAGLPVILLLPGLAILASLLPDRPWRGELLAWAVGTSLACVIVLGVLLNEVANLDRRTEITALALLSLLGFVIGAVRSAGRPASEPVPSRISLGGLLTKRHSPVVVMSVLVALASVGAACWLSVSSGHAQNRTAFTELWLAAPGHGAASGNTDLAVRNDEGQPIDYTLQLETSAGSKSWHLQLQPQQTWKVPVTVPSDGRATAKLYRAGTTAPYRVVSLSPAEGS